VAALTILFSTAVRPGGAAAGGRVAVAAASDLKFAMDEIVRAFAKQRPDLTVAVTYGSSGNFYAQLSSGAPFDVFFSADVEYTRRLATQGLTVPGSEFVYAVGRIVLWVPRSSTLDLDRGLDALRDPSVRKIAIANPQHAPYGRAAEAALKAAKVHADVRSKLVFGENVAQAAQFVQSGAADAGIIALSLATAPVLAAEGRYREIPLDAYPRMEQGGVILKRAPDVAAARAFREFVLGADGRATLARYGFSAP
jgi:molybdate transport system substrate-binding protein